MSNAVNSVNYPSCIKIPPIHAPSRQTMSNAMVPQKFDVKETLTLNSELISLANRLFGKGKWSHAVTSQTIDFVESFMGKYVCGCATFVKIQLHDGTFHEDMGYCHAEGAMKGFSIHCARTGSLTDAFKKVLSCFDNTIETEVEKLTKKLPNSQTNNLEKDDLQISFPLEQFDIHEPCAQSTPFIVCKNDLKGKQENACQPKSPCDQEEQTSAQPTIKKSKSATEQKLKTAFDVKGQLQSNGMIHKNEKGNILKGPDQKKGLSEEELIRMERKRKQMEKQAEFKQRMKEREQQRGGENKKFNPKY